LIAWVGKSRDQFNLWTLEVRRAVPYIRRSTMRRVVHRGRCSPPTWPEQLMAGNTGCDFVGAPERGGPPAPSRTREPSAPLKAERSQLRRGGEGAQRFARRFQAAP